MSTDSNILLNNISEGILMLDKYGQIVFCNRMVEKITGFSEFELINKPFYFLNDDQDVIKTEYELDLVLKKGTLQLEGWKRRKNEQAYWGETVLAPVYNGTNELEGYSCVLQDISERKQTEISLRQSEERYRLMVEAVRDYSIFMLDKYGNIVTWNDGGLRIQGYLSTDIIGKHFSIFYTADDLAGKKPERELEIAVKTGKYEEEGWRVRKNGSVFWASIVITALFNEFNELIGFSKVTRDLSERVRDDEILRLNEERYRLLVEQVIDYGIFMLDERGRIVSWNEGARRIKGYSADEIIGKYFSIFYTEEDILTGKPARELKIAKAEGKYEEEGWRLRKDGSRFWANIVITAVYNEHKILIGFSKVTRDLTERKKSEQILKESFESSRRLAGELKEMNVELSYANKELEQFTSIVSHDLQEPVRTIKSFLHLISLQVSDGKHDGLPVYIDKSLNAANRMKELIDNLLHYSQISKGEILKEIIVVEDLIEEAIQGLKASLDVSNARVKIENEVDTIEADRVQILQVLQNLLGNALKFTNGRAPEIMIRSRRVGREVEFSVIDNGIGIAQDSLNKIFDVFRRLHSQNEYPGTGMGLAICKKVVERHHGKIWVESSLGTGTTFYFTIKDSGNSNQQMS